MNLTSLRKQFPFPEYGIVHEALELNVNGTGPLVEHGTLAGRRVVAPGREPEWRDAVAKFLSENSLDESDPAPFMGGILSITEEFAPEPEAEPEQVMGESVAGASINEQLIFMASFPYWRREYAARYGLGEATMTRAKGIKLMQSGPNGFPMLSHNKNRISQRLVEELDVGQSVYRVKDGEVQKVSVVGKEGTPTVASSEAGTTVDEEEEERLATEDSAKDLEGLEEDCNEPGCEGLPDWAANGHYDKGDLITGVYWWSCDYHSGMGSDGYKAQSIASQIFRPGPGATGPEPESAEQDVYDSIESEEQALAIAEWAKQQFADDHDDDDDEPVALQPGYRYGPASATFNESVDLDRLLAESPVPLGESRDITTYSSWLRAVKREHKSATVQGNKSKAIAKFKGRQFASWDGSHGEVF